MLKLFGDGAVEEEIEQRLVAGVPLSGIGSTSVRATSAAPSTSAAGCRGSDSMWATMRSKAAAASRRISSAPGSSSYAGPLTG